MALYLIYVNAGVKISDNLKRIVQNIEREKAAAYVAGVKA